jgi:FAD/FMN-containing dehydrogenase
VTTIETLLKTASAEDTQALRSRLRGEVVVADDEQYDTARRVHNLTFDRRPAIIVRPQGTADVAEAVKFARSRGYEIAVRSGGHSAAGHSSVDGSLVIDFSAMKGISIDDRKKTARVEAGVTSGDLAGPAHAYGLSLSTGDTSTVALGGLVTGGGIGWMVRKHGLTIDNLISAEVVTADGGVIRASAREHSDLFWAIRGGGGNFGVVTEFEFKLWGDGSVYGGALVLPATPEVIRGYLDYAVSAPDELTTIGTVMHAPPAPFIPENTSGRRYSC